VIVGKLGKPAEAHAGTGMDVNSSSMGERKRNLGAYDVFLRKCEYIGHEVGIE
jgi:hypothetical protein